MADNLSSQDNRKLDTVQSVREYSLHGHNVAGIEGVSEKFKCVFCNLIINIPMQLTECGHRSCQNCLEDLIKRSNVEDVQCTYVDCHIITKRKDVMYDKAFKKELDSLRIDCIHNLSGQCNWSGTLRDYQNHLDASHNFYICEHCKARLLSKEAFDEHLTKICPALFQQCLLAPLCTDQMIRRSEYADHLLKPSHQDVLQKLLIGEYQLPSAPIQQQQQENLKEQFEKELEEKVSVHLSSLGKDIDKVKDDTIKLNDNLTGLENNLNVLIQDYKNIFALLNEKSIIKDELHPRQMKIQSDIAKLHDLIQETEQNSIDGTLIWIVDRVSERMADAQSERQTSVYSPIFYSSTTGYKMRLRLFLFGDGSARRTHMSLFFLLMKGEYDAILKWPFNFKITFCLIDQTGNNRHVIDSFYPDVKSVSFQRPKTEANTASGIPKFFPLPMLLQDDNPYVRDDTLFIKVIVGFNETPKTLLPYLLTLNPALPTHVQENLVNIELSKEKDTTTKETVSASTGK